MTENPQSTIDTISALLGVGGGAGGGVFLYLLFKKMGIFGGGETVNRSIDEKMDKMIKEQKKTNRFLEEILKRRKPS